MDFRCRLVSIVILFTAIFLLGATSKDPIGWNQAGSIPARTTLYTRYQVDFVVVNNLGFNMPSPLNVIQHASSNEFLIKDNCSGTQLAVNGTCSLSIAFTPKEIGKKTLNMVIAYGNNRVQLPTVETTTSENKDPIILTEQNTLPAETTTHSKYKILYTITSNLPFAMTSPLSVAYQASSDEFIMQDGCTGQKLDVGGSCSLEVTFMPLLVGAKFMNIAVIYGHFSIQLPPLATKTHSIGTPNVNGQVTKELPPFTRVGSSYEIKWTFTNSGTDLASNFTFNKNYANAFVETSNSCGAIIPVGQSCEIVGLFSSTTLGQKNLNIVFNYSGGEVSASTTTKVIDPGLGRVLSFVNNCDHDVWFGVHGGVADELCVTDANCPIGSTCRVDAGTSGLCYWPNPFPHFPRGQYLLTAKGGTNYVLALDVNPEQDTIWSGSVAGRTGCVGGSCETADCHSEGGDNACPLGVDFEKPTTIASLILNRTAADKYKIDASNGINVPMSIKPTNVPASSEQPYVCGAPGASIPSHPQLGACSWTFSPPTVNFVQVSADSLHACEADSDCSENNVCGLNYDATRTPVFQKTCGKKIGYWTANEACSKSPEGADPYFQCNTNLRSVSGYTRAALYSCMPPDRNLPQLNNCYAFNNNQCCGCANWQEQGISLPSSTEQCPNQNSEWMDQVLPGLQWLKQACPTLAVYPNDDKSSTFTCQTPTVGDNQVDYTITFCPNVKEED